MVAYDNGQAVPVRPLTLDTEAPKTQFRDAERRKQLRLKAARQAAHSDPVAGVGSAR
jgi:hypothetical protein